MPEPLLLAVAQPACTPYDVAANATRHAQVVRATNARVVVFPELSLTGYELDAPALDPKDERLAPLTEACADTGALALAGVAGVLFSARGGERVRTIAGRHGVWVALACFAGSTGDYPQTSGGSGIWNPTADAIVQASAEPGTWVAAKLE